ncbi:MAG TPA: Rid family detoxifying hydrolase [Acidimicrobiales bacterium]|nr:Rid family detoxifying hydrolase [Acidimicrobiales bacterium]
MSTPVGPYAPAVRAGPWLVCSGQIGLRTGSGGPVLVDGGVAAEARQALENVRVLLRGRGLGWDSVVKTTVFLADMADYATFNEIYVEAIGDHRPARSVVAVAGLPLGALVEVEAWAYIPQ